MNVLRTREEIILFSAAFSVKLLFIAFFVYMHGVTPELTTLQSDGYAPLAEHLYAQHAFTFSTTTPLVPEALHVPGYPLFLALTAIPFGTPLIAFMLQALMLAYSAVLLYRLTAGFFSERTRFWGAFVYGVEPFAAFMAASLLTESLFMFLFLGALYGARVAYERNSLWLWSLAGFLFGASVLVRPVGLYLVPVLLVGAGLAARKQNKIILGALVGLVCFVAVPGAWAARNYAHFGAPVVATKGPFTLYFYNVEQLLEYKLGLTPHEAAEYLFAEAKKDNPELAHRDDLRSPVYAGYLSKKSMEFIRADLLLYLKLQTLSLGTFFLSDGYRLLLQSMEVPIAPLPNLTKTIANGAWGELATYFMQNPYSLIVFVAGTLFWGLAALLAGLSPIVAWRSKDGRALLGTILFACMIAYFAVLTGPVAQARYRVVVEPFLFILAAYTLLKLHAWYKSL